MTKEELLAVIQQAHDEQWEKLDLSNKEIETLPAEIVLLSHLKSLILSGCSLKKFPIEIISLRSLRRLDLQNNQLQSLPPEIYGLINLEMLDLENNLISQLPPEITQLKNLGCLNLNNNQFSQLLPEITALNLYRLDLDSNRLTQLPPEISNLSNLVQLGLADNQLRQLPSEIASLKKLFGLDLSKNQLSRLPTEFTALNRLSELYLENNKLRKFPPEILSLSGLQQLVLSGNKLSHLPPEITALKYLEQLDLQRNQLNSFSPEIVQFSSLLVLDLRNNSNTLPYTIGNLKKQGDGIYTPKNSPSLPKEILNKNSFDIYYWYLADENDNLRLIWPFEVKLNILGEGKVGKTCLVNRLLHDTFTEQCKTEGIDINQWYEYPIDDLDIQMRINVWDFGGQEVLHATHQFFLTKRSVYLLVLDARRGEQESRLEYWLKLIQSFGSNSPIIVVINKYDEEHRLTLNQRFLKDKYPTIQDFYFTSCISGNGISELKQGIHNTLAELPHIHDLMPETWFKLKQTLEQRDDNYISYQTYQQLCLEHEIEEQGAQKTLCGFLHDLGIALNFQDDERLNDTNVLNPEWVTSGVYKLLNNLELFQKHGVLTLSDLARILDAKEYPSRKEHQFIIDMMQKFELCFPISDHQDQYLIPELLQNEEPDLNWDKPQSLAFEYHYDVLPHSVFTRFIVRLHDYISQKTYWRTGVVLKHQAKKALIKADLEDKKIFIWINGHKPTRRDFLSIIRKEFQHIHKTIAKIEAREKVPLASHPKVTIDYQHLLKLEERGMVEYYYPEIDDFIDVKALLSGIENRQQPTAHVTNNYYGDVRQVDANSYVEGDNSGNMAGRDINIDKAD